MKARLRAKRGGRDIKRLKRRSKEARVRVGILAGGGEHPKATNGQTYAEIAFWNELGTARIPPRPFLSTSVREHDHYRSSLIPALAAYLRGETSVIASLNLIGLRAAADVRNKMVQIMTPPNSRSTQIKKARTVKADSVNNPLIDSGSLRASIAHEVK